MPTIANYIVNRLLDCGVRHLFGLPGTSCSDLFDAAIAGGMETIVASTELEAGYAAEGYARRAGLSAVTVSYGVGTLNMANAIASGLTERSPIIVINGGPSERQLFNERQYGALFPHSTGRPFTDLEVFREICGSAIRVQQPRDAVEAFDESVAYALRYQVPVYVELPQDFWTMATDHELSPLNKLDKIDGDVDAHTLRVIERLQTAQKPAILVGVEVARYHLQGMVTDLIRKSGALFATTLLSKTTLSEAHPSFVGVYDSGWAPKSVKEVIEGADMLLALGVCFGIDHLDLLKKQQPQLVWLYEDKIRFADEDRQSCDLADFIDAVVDRLPISPDAPEHQIQSFSEKRRALGVDRKNHGPLTHDALFAELNNVIAPDVQVVMDTCLGSFPGADLEMKNVSCFEGNPVWLSIGQSVGAAIGVGLASNDRVMVICGDGGFQTIAQALSTLAKLKLKALVVIINNKSYAIEQYLIDDKFFIDPSHPPLEYTILNDWDYCKVAQGMGFRQTGSVNTIEDLRESLKNVGSWREPVLIVANISSRDLPAENRSTLP